MNIFKDIGEQLAQHNLRIVSFDHERPWGGFFVINEEDAGRFADIYFEDLNFDNLLKGGKLSPKILLVKPQARLSWQYHDRRAETWRIISGPVGVVRSSNDAEQPVKIHNEGETITLKKGEPHRLIGLENWGMVAEFWQHTNPAAPSNEEDIVRLQDDYLRK
jgi:mannose-6-phosphate isomerase-like protein (cupin superfamily)